METQENNDVQVGAPVIETPVEETPAVDAPVVDESADVVVEPVAEELVTYFEGHKVVEKGELKDIGGVPHYSCVCDDGATYDVPASLF